MENEKKLKKDFMIKEPTCPHCNTIQKGEPFKSWEYGFEVYVKRFKCKCGKTFNYYKGPYMTWTIPKRKKQEKT